MFKVNTHLFRFKRKKRREKESESEETRSRARARQKNLNVTHGGGPGRLVTCVTPSFRARSIARIFFLFAMNARGIFPRSPSARPSVHSIVDAMTTASFYKVSFLIVLSSPRKFRRASLLEYAPETGSCRCWWTFGGKEGGYARGRGRGEKGGGLSHQGRNTRTRWYGKPIIIVFTRQQRAAIKNCLFIQARLFSIRSHTNDGFP